MRTSMFVLVTLLGFSNFALADMAITVDSSVATGLSVPTNQSIGWRFSVSETITITHLGLYDAGEAGLENEHTMGIWRVKSAGGLRLERWLSIGPDAVSEGNHVYEPLSNPLTIGPGDRWLVGVWNSASNADALTLYPHTTATYAGIFTPDGYPWKSWESTPDTTLGDIAVATANWVPWGTINGNDHYGVNFLYTPVQVPAPAALLLGVIGLGHAGWCLRRRTPITDPNRVG